MADTLGGIIDKLFTIDMKMWNNQEALYDIRRMSFEEFKAKFFASELEMQNLWNVLKKACDLNVQRNQLIDEIDQKIIEMIVASKDSDLDSGKYLQRKHKTY